jgi:hypothetical protein
MKLFSFCTQIASFGVFYRGAIAKGQKSELAGARTLVSGWPAKRKTRHRVPRGAWVCRFKTLLKRRKMLKMRRVAL